MIATGLDRLLESTEVLARRRYGLLAHAASVSADLVPVHLALIAAGAPPPAALFGAEHGFYGVEQDMAPAAAARDPWTGAPILSLYGDSPASLRPAPPAFSGLDLLVIDLQDVGSRYYTYATTAIWAAEAALAAGREVWVLDRPNPLGGVAVEGNLLRPGLESFVGAFALPVRHGLTLGELVRLIGTRRGWADRVRVWPLAGWSREMLWNDVRRPWIAPSPNMPGFATAIAYPGSCLVEATELSEGRGTTRPFRLVGAPHLDPLVFAGRLEARGLAGVKLLPTFFKPQFHKHRGEVCGGVEILVTDAESFRPYRFGVELLLAAWEADPRGFAWRLAPYEFEAGRPAIDLLTGDRALREAIASGTADASAWLATWPDDEAAFRRERASILLYPDPSETHP